MILDGVVNGGRGEESTVPLSTAAALVRTARPLQWTKNVLVFAAPGAAGVLDDWPELGAALLAFVAFCLASSGIYLWNDVLDVDADRRHPTKRLRPIAAGQLGIGTAQLTGTLLLVAACAVAELLRQPGPAIEQPRAPVRVLESHADAPCIEFRR